jgi:hypothetical protein
MGLRQAEKSRGLGVEKKFFIIIFTLLRLDILNSRVCTVHSGFWQKFLQLITSTEVSADKYLCHTKILLQFDDLSHKTNHVMHIKPLKIWQ